MGLSRNRSAISIVTMIVVFGALSTNVHCGLHITDCSYGYESNVIRWIIFGGSPCTYKCPSGYHQNVMDDGCFPHCPVAFYNHHTHECSHPQCPDGYRLWDESSACVHDCPAGYVLKLEDQVCRLI